MPNPNPTRHASSRMLAAVLTWAMILGQLTQPVYAQLTPLADIPIAAKVTAKPNIVYTVDDSGSMNSNFIPDFVTAGAYPAVCPNAPSGDPSPQTDYGTNSGG